MTDKPRSKPPTWAQQLAASREELRDATDRLAVLRSRGVELERIIKTRDEEVAALRDLVHGLEIDAAEMRGYLAKIADDAPPATFVQERPKPSRYGSQGSSGGYADASAGFSVMGREARAPWYRR